MKLRLRSSVMGNARLGLTLGVTLAALAGCSDDDSPNVIPDVEAGVDAAATGNTEGPVDTTGGSGGGESSTTTTPTTSEGPDTLTVGATGTTEPGTAATSSEPVDPTSAPTGGNLSSGVPTEGTDVTSDTIGVDPTTGVVDSTGGPSTDDTSDLPPNLVENWDFETGTTGWYSWGNNGEVAATLTASADKANTGSQSVLVSGSATFGPLATVLPAEAGATYEVTFFASAASGTGQIRIVRSLECLAGTDQQYLWVVGNTAISSDGFTELTGTFTIPADCDSTTFQVYAEGSTALDAYIDTVSVRLISHGDGDTGSDTSAGPDTTGVIDTGVVTTPDVDSGVVDTGDGGTVGPLNLVANSGFEVDNAGWYSWANGVTLTASADKSHSGEQSLLISGGDAIGPAAIQLDAIPGGTYDVSMWASTGSGSTDVRVTRSLECLPADGGRWMWVVGDTEITDSAWTELAGTFTIPEDCDSPTFQIYLEGNAADVDVYLDDVSVTLVSGGGGEETTEPGETTAPDVTTAEPEVTTDIDAGVDETMATDASVDDTTMVEEVDASVDASVDNSTSEVVDTSVAPETSAPADTTMVDETSAPDPYGADIITNGNFETGSWWWYASPGNPVTIAQTTAVAHGGTGSLLTTGRSDNWHGPALNLLAGGVTQAITQGSTYFVQAYVRLNGSASDNIGLSISQTCDSVDGFPSIDSATVTNTEWTLLEGTFTVPTCTSLSTFALYAQSSTSTTVEFYIDDVSIRQVLP